MKRKVALITIIAILLTMLTACAKPEAQLSVTELLDLGEKYLLEMNYEQAVVQFLKVIEIEPKNPRGYTGAAEAYVGLGQMDKAIAVLRQGQEQLPDDPEIMEKMSELSNADYERIYTEYMESTQWQDEYEPQDEYESDITDFKITTFKIFDLDDNGIPELWFHAESSNELGPGRPARRDIFCTIEGSNVIQLLSGYISGGSMGGEEITVYYDTKALAHVICKEGHAGGFGGSAEWTEVYDFSNGSITEVIQYQSINQIASNYVDGELDNSGWYYPSDREIGGEALFIVYYVDGEQVQKETYDRVSNRFIAPINEDFKLQ